MTAPSPVTPSAKPSPQPAIILIDPQLGENIGMVARAMLNCGLTDLRLVRPRDGWPSESANAASSGALEKGVIVRVYDTTQDAVADCQVIMATTARPREMIKTVHTPRAAIAAIRDDITARGLTCGVLFGAERSGLQNEDVAIADAVITVPLNPDFTSLNLAQAVLLVGYEWISAQTTTPDTVFTTGTTDIASKETVLGLVGRLESTLDAHHFFRSPEMKPSIARNLVNLFTRMRMTDQEASTFHGIISALSGAKTALSARAAAKRGGNSGN